MPALGRAKLYSDLTSTIQNTQDGILWFGSDVAFIQSKTSDGNVYRLQIEKNGSITLWYSTDGGANFTPKQVSPSPFA